MTALENDTSFFQACESFMNGDDRIERMVVIWDSHPALQQSRSA